jgi:hypothetical protein
MSHRVKTHYWERGHLTTREYLFETYEEALLFSKNGRHHSAKVYDYDGFLIEEICHEPEPQHHHHHHDYT